MQPKVVAQVKMFNASLMLPLSQKWWMDASNRFADCGYEANDITPG